MPSMNFSFPENLTISNVHSLHDELEVFFEKESGDELILHAENVTRADTAGMQLALALVNLSKERQMAVVWSGASSKFSEVANILGLSDALGLH